MLTMTTVRKHNDGIAKTHDNATSYSYDNQAYTGITNSSTSDISNNKKHCDYAYDNANDKSKNIDDNNVNDSINPLRLPQVGH